MADTIRARIATAQDDRERRLLRADAIVSAGAVSVARGQRIITVIDGPRRVGDVVELTVRVEESGVDVTPRGLNPVRIVNPPVLVPDPAGTVIITSRTRTRPGRAWTQVQHRYREDPAEALRVILASLVP